MTVREMLVELKNEKIHTWFDLGLFIDRFKENKKTPTAADDAGKGSDVKESPAATSDDAPSKSLSEKKEEEKPEVTPAAPVEEKVEEKEAEPIDDGTGW